MAKRSSSVRQEQHYFQAYGRRLVIARIVLGLSEKQVAEAHGVTLATYRGWEAGGVQRGSRKAMLSFVKAHDVCLNWLISGEGCQLNRRLSVNPGGKVAILPASTAEGRRLRVQSASMAGDVA